MTPVQEGIPPVTLTLIDDAPVDYFDPEFEDELVLEIRLAELVIALSGCSAQRAFRLVRRRDKETPFDRLTRALSVTRSAIAAAQPVLLR